jgi:hypothetical protein
MKRLRWIAALSLCALSLSALAACGSGDSIVAPGPNTSVTPKLMRVLGSGSETARYTAEIAVRGTTAYTTTWGSRGGLFGNKIDIWDVSGLSPTLVDSVFVSSATTLGDVAVSDDGSLLVVATETSGGSIAIFSLADPRKPALITQFRSPDTDPGVHTAEIGRVNGKLYGFLAIDPRNSIPARLVTVDLSVPSAPREVFTKVIGNPFVHDTFVRDGLLFLALWDDGMQIWDVGGGGRGGSPENPVAIGGVKTVNGEVHNIWWYHDPVTGSARYAFIGEEGPGTVGTSSRGDIHVVDLQDMTNPREVAFYHVDGAGTHNFSVDEQNGVLYAAYYNAGVRAIDVRGDLTTCTNAQREAAVTARCDLRLMGRELATGLTSVGEPVYVWGVQYVAGTVYASDMLNGIWKLESAR